MVAGGAVGVGTALAYSGDESGAKSSQAEAALPETAPQVTLVQKVMDRVVIRSVRDPKSRLSANGRDLWAISSLGSFDVPSAAVRAYKSAAAELARTRPSCQMPWTLLAGIGRVESDHGRYGGSELGTDGLPRPAIVGIALDGEGPVAAIHDSDGGRWDGDKVWDRAVGPMQFIPGTWKSSGRDGDGDGVANPNDIDDAALAAAYYLCPSSGSILSDAAMDAAIRSYNNSAYYVDLVEAFKHGYETGVFVIPSPPPAAGVSADAPQVKPKVTKVDKQGKPVKGGTKASSGSSGGTSTGGKHPTSSPKPTSTPTKTPTSSTPKPSPTTSTPKPTPPPTTFEGVLSKDGASYKVGTTVLNFGPLGDPAADPKAARLEALLNQGVTAHVGANGIVDQLNGQPW